jgi:putative heme-binding domain-containing protein
MPHDLGRGIFTGPDLSGIGARFTPEKISQAILSPSADIAPDYTHVISVTSRGRKVDGLVKNESADSIPIQDLQGPS